VADFNSKPERALSVLHVDDDPVNLRVVEEILTAFGHRAVKALSGPEALEALSRQAFDVVLTDISMPGLNGKELLDKMVELYPGTTVIVVSGHSDQGQAESLLSHGAFDYLLKPFRLEVVEESVKRAVISRGH